MRAIPTTYKGTPFRSRLEADWASTFDALLLPWVYEPEGYELSDGTRYLPDFWLPTARAWVEVKGSHDQRISKMEQFAADLWAESGAETTHDRKSPMILKVVSPRDDPMWSRTGLVSAQFPLGVSGVGYAYSAAWARCPRCHQSTAISLWQDWCRNCGGVVENPIPDWGTFKMLDVPWSPVPRWNPR